MPFFYTSSRGNKDNLSFLIIIMVEILLPKSSVNLIGPRVSSATGWNVKIRCKRFCIRPTPTPLSTGWAKKTIGPVWALITQRWLVLERRVIRQKFQNAVKNKKKTNLHREAFKYFLPNLHKYSSAPKICQIWLLHMDLTWTFELL